MKKTATILACAALLAACTQKPQENPEARALVSEAQACFEAADYQQAIALLDSLQRTYPSELNLQREGMGLRPKVIEQQALAEIALIDSLTAADMLAMQQLKPLLKWVKEERMIEGYWVDAKSYAPNFMNSTGAQARVSEIGQFYLVSSVNPAGNLRHTSVTVSANGESASTPAVPYDGESNYRIGGGEVITFSPEQSDTIGRFVSRQLAVNPSAPVTLTFRGSSNKSQKLSGAQAQGIANAWQYSQAVERARENQVRRQRMEQTAALARRQQGIQE